MTEEHVVLETANWVNAGGFMLLAIGAGFLIMELFLPTFGLFGFSGIAALMIGTVILDQTGYIETMDVNVPALIGVAVVALILSGVSGWYLFKLYKQKLTTGPESLIGETGTVADWTGTSGHVRVQGDIWQAFSDAPLPLKPDDKVLVTRVDNLKLKIRLSESE